MGARRSVLLADHTAHTAERSAHKLTTKRIHNRCDTNGDICELLA